MVLRSVAARARCLPSFEGSWRYDAAAKAIQIDLAQTQAGDAYRVRVHFGVVAAAGQPARIERVDMAGKRQSFTIPVATEPAEVTFDPDTWLLADRITFVKRQPQ